MSLGRWHTAQFLKSIGATSLVKVTCLLAGLLLFALITGSANRDKVRRGKIAMAETVLFISFTCYVSLAVRSLREAFFELRSRRRGAAIDLCPALMVFEK